ncbi:MAG: hypothetical protein HYR76_11230 [Ignavibacteria bacterium]|nr:hypothetical protein [Ignavibacteria bacterium]
MKSTLFLVAATLVVLIQSSAQNNNWSVSVKNGPIYDNVSLQALVGDSLSVRDSMQTYMLPIASIAKVVRDEHGSRVATGLVVGAVTGSALGFLAAQLLDKKSPSGNYYYYSSGEENNKTAYMLVGGGVGSLVGLFAGLSSVTKTYNLQKMGLEERRITLESILWKEGRQLSHAQPEQRDVAYLKNGSIIRGTIFEVIPDSTVTIQTADKSMFKFKMTEIEKITKEVSTTDSTIDFKKNDPPKPVFGVYAGLAAPAGEFGATDLNGGAAKTGFCFGGEMSLQTTAGIGWLSSLTFLFNGVDASSLVLPDSFHATVDVGPWFLIMPMTGVRFGGPISPNIAIFGLGQIGLLIGNSPEINMSINSPTARGSVKVASATGTAFTFAVGGGLIFNNNITAGARYLHGEPEYTLTISGNGGSVSSKGKQSTSIFQITAGYNF